MHVRVHLLALQLVRLWAQAWARATALQSDWASAPQSVLGSVPLSEWALVLVLALQLDWASAPQSEWALARATALQLDWASGWASGMPRYHSSAILSDPCRATMLKCGCACGHHRLHNFWSIA